ncbi:copper amine oxidase [Aspergillus spectabilis]
MATSTHPLDPLTPVEISLAAQLVRDAFPSSSLVFRAITLVEFQDHANLRGCDCLGHIKYFDAYHHTNDGVPIKLPRVICCHEIDDGILWKHTNYRTNNAVVGRSRVLVLQTIITVSNYEYIFAFQFTQSAEINYEVRATGILSTNPIDIDESGTFPYGTVVAPGVMAPYHQHLFSLRIDPAIDGHNNSLLVEESVPMAVEDSQNPVRVGYVTNKEYVEHETPLDTDNRAARVFKIVNENIINPATGTPVGYKLVPHYSQMLLAHPTSYHALRSEFGEYPVWVTRHHDDELFAAGEYTVLSETGSGLATWIKTREAPQSVRNEDIVVWHTFGSTHNLRVEDWPVMPVEKMMVTLKPINFFTRNLALDVPISNQRDNKSVLVFGGECCDRSVFKPEILDVCDADLKEAVRMLRLIPGWQGYINLVPRRAQLDRLLPITHKLDDFILVWYYQQVAQHLDKDMEDAEANVDFTPVLKRLRPRPEPAAHPHLARLSIPVKRVVSKFGDKLHIIKRSDNPQTPRFEDSDPSSSSSSDSPMGRRREPDDRDYKEREAFPAVSGKNFVYTLLVAFSSTVTFSIKGVKGHWSQERTGYKVRFGDTKLHEARTDGIYSCQIAINQGLS